MSTSAEITERLVQNQQEETTSTHGITCQRGSTMDTGTSMEKLFQSLHQRRRPEDVAQMVLEQLQGRFTKNQEAILQKVAQGSLKRQVMAYTSMLEDFAKPVGLVRQVAVAGSLFAYPTPPTGDQCDDPRVVEAYIRQINQQIHKEFGKNDFQTHRLNRKNSVLDTRLRSRGGRKERARRRKKLLAFQTVSAIM